MIKKFIGLIFCVCSVASVQAQIVATIGVGDVTVSTSSDQLSNSAATVDAIKRQLQAELLETRKFRVLGYSQLIERLARQDLNLQGYYNKSYSRRQYQQAGLDYILVADVAKASSEPSPTVDVKFTLIGVADVTADFESSVTARVSAATGSIDRALAKALDLVVDRVIVHMFPIRVMQLNEGGSVTLNYGEGILQPGDKIEVYPLGQSGTVSTDGEPTGEPLAMIEVVTAERKFSIARAISGQDAITRGQKGKLIIPGE